MFQDIYYDNKITVNCSHNVLISANWLKPHPRFLKLKKTHKNGYKIRIIIFFKYLDRGNQITSITFNTFP
jgi:hypothetical protein